MDLREIKLSRDVIYSGKIINVYNDKVLCPNGRQSTREFVTHPGGAAILFISPNNEVMLIKQFRYVYDEVIYEIPAGKIENKEDPYNTAIREFEEETGSKTDKLEFLGKIYPTCGYTNEIIYLYLAKDYVKTQTNFDPDEQVLVEFVPLDKVNQMILDGTIKDAKTIAALYYYMIRNNK